MKELYDNIFEALYEEAVPGLEEIEEYEYSGETPVNYLHFLDGDRQIEVIEEYCEEYGVPVGDRKQVKFNLILGKSPSSSLENVNNAREDEGLKPVEEFLDESV
ncbi:hypothetical protein [Halorubrum vacuolatum]|uniref:Uncharacterized protein n=1 Tax=Halorubrum vacuolatum TaxID=63740 RepID=A0A238YH76_HALVU|nr:hypothetical protein [Halorubrum vacuolatum]SNR70430.1 hypothetical protein SAMN06264855_1442 [Halorubrum vacuolatum]